MAHPISNIPEILQMIFKALDQKHLARILTVSRRFFLCAIPILWEDISSLGRLRRLVFPSIRPRPQNVTQGWIDSIQELDERSLRRFNLYAPLIKSFRYHASDWSRNDWPREQRDLSWRAILKAVPMRPLLLNLAKLDLSDDVQTTPTTQILEALICPKLTRIRAPGLEFANGVFNPVLSTGLLSKIAHSCPKIQELIVFPSNKPLTAPRTGVSATPESPPSPNCLASLAQLGNLRTLYTGPEALSSCALDMLGALPSLESFVVFAPPDTPGQVFPVQLSAPANGFLALQHLGFFHGSPFRITQSWRILPCVQMLTAVTIKTDSALVTNDNDLYDLVCAICQFSPKVAELHLDLSPDSDSLFDIQLLTPTVISHLKRLPLRRLRIRTRGIQLLPPEDYKQLALALPNVEYLDLQECYFTYQGIEYLAKFNRKLQFLCVNLYRGGWPSKDELPMSPVFSSSILCLRSNYTTDTTFWDVSKDTKKGFIDSLSTALHRLWPNGVHCIFSEHAAESCDIEAREEEDLESINSAIRQLCAPDTFDSPDIRSAEQWKYANYGLGLSFL